MGLHPVNTRVLARVSPTLICSPPKGQAAVLSWGVSDVSASIPRSGHLSSTNRTNRTNRGYGQRRLSWIREQREELKKNAFLGTARQMPRGNGTRDLTYRERVTDVEKCMAPRVCGGRERLGG